MSPFSYAGRSPSIPICDGQEKGNLLNILTQAINVVLHWTQMYTAINKINIPPPKDKDYGRIKETSPSTEGFSRYGP